MVKKNKVLIKCGDSPKDQTIFINGVDISTFVTDCELTIRAGEFPSLTLKIIPINLEFEGKFDKRFMYIKEKFVDG